MLRQDDGLPPDSKLLTRSFKSSRTWARSSSVGGGSWTAATGLVKDRNSHTRRRQSTPVRGSATAGIPPRGPPRPLATSSPPPAEPLLPAVGAHSSLSGRPPRPLALGDPFPHGPATTRRSPGHHHSRPRPDARLHPAALQVSQDSFTPPVP